MKYVLTKHAVERYRERCQRPMSTAQAEKDLRNLMTFAEYHDQPPQWAYTIRENDGCLVMGDVALVVQGRYLVTCIVRGALPPWQRRQRNERKRRRKRAKARRRGI